MILEEQKALDIAVTEVKLLLTRTRKPEYSGAPVTEGLGDTLMAFDREYVAQERARKQSGKVAKGTQLVKPSKRQQGDASRVAGAKVSRWTSREELPHLTNIKQSAKHHMRMANIDPFNKDHHH